MDLLILKEGKSLIQKTPQMGEQNTFMQMLTSYEDQLASITEFNSRIEQLGTYL